VGAEHPWKAASPRHRRERRHRAALSRRLAAAGAAVAVSYGANAAAAGEVVHEIASAGQRAVAIGADLRKAEAAEAPRRRRRAGARLGATCWSPTPACAADSSSMRSTWRPGTSRWRVNLRAPFLARAGTSPACARGGGDRVLFMSSVAAFTGGLVARIRGVQGRPPRADALPRQRLAPLWRHGQAPSRRR